MKTYKSHQFKLSEGLEDLLFYYKLEDGMHQQEVIHLWNEIMPESVTSFTTDIRLYGDVLYLKMSSAPLKNEILMQRSSILETLNSKINGFKIKDIR